jgi:hypothetical protein
MAGEQAAMGSEINLSTELNRAGAPSFPLGKIWRSILGLIFWAHERGSVQYDVMVTLILLFLFLSPRMINFKDRPVERNPHSTGVLVYPDGNGALIYQIEARAVPAADDSGVRAALLAIIEPISGSVSISRYERVKDAKGRVIAYKVWVERE